MKRSEMLTVLRESILYHMNPIGPAKTDEEMYSNVLEDLERAGMTPPIEVFSLQGRNGSYYTDGWDKE